MAYNQQIAQRIRQALATQPDVEEKRMIKGLTFMVNGKMCVNVVDDELMCRIDPELFDSLLQQPGCRPMEMKGKILKGYVLVDEAAIKKDENFRYWINLALDFNDRAKASKKRKKQ